MILCVIAFDASAQRGIISAGGGALTCLPLAGRFVNSTDGFNFDWTYSYQSSAGSYLTVSYVGRPLRNKKVCLRVPVSASFMSVTTRYHLSGYSYGCFVSEEFDGLVIHSRQRAGIGSGILAYYQSGQQRISGGVRVLAGKHLSSHYAREGEMPYHVKPRGIFYQTVAQVSYAFHAVQGVWLGVSFQAIPDGTFRNMPYLKVEQVAQPRFGQVWLGSSLNLSADL